MPADRPPDGVRPAAPDPGAEAPSARPDARAVAIDILIEVIDHHKALDRELERSRDFRLLDDRDRRFAHRLVLATIRRLGEIDATIETMLARPLPQRARDARMILRAGLAQILFLETPAHATVDTAVRLARARKQENYAKLINAALRRAAREAEAGGPAERAPEINTPAWLWSRWVSVYGIETARTIARAHMDEPPLDLSVKTDPQRWAENLQAEILPTGVLRRPSGGKITDLPGYADGEWWVQDFAATLPVRLLGMRPGQRVIDLCAAPGGKTAQLCMSGASVTAVERSAERAKRLSENLARLSLDADIIVDDALTWKPAFQAEAVLLDAPCTATGTLRRHPDVAWTKKPSDIASLSKVQAALLKKAAEMVSPGGRLVYCACSLEPEEGQDQALAFLASTDTFTNEPIDPGEIGGLGEAIDANGWLRTLPCHLGPLGGMDGFFAARFRRR
jgi:16S rRNA (cytosine967-C5)-methyltransferase